MNKYIVKAYDITKNKIITFNQNLTSNYEDAKKLAKHLKKECSEYFKNITLTTLELKIISTTIEEI